MPLRKVIGAAEMAEKEDRDTGRYALWPLFFSPLTYAYV